MKRDSWAPTSSDTAGGRKPPPLLFPLAPSKCGLLFVGLLAYIFLGACFCLPFFERRSLKAFVCKNPLERRSPGKKDF